MERKNTSVNPSFRWKSTELSKTLINERHLTTNHLHSVNGKIAEIFIDAHSSKEETTI